MYVLYALQIIAFQFRFLITCTGNSGNSRTRSYRAHSLNNQTSQKQTETAGNALISIKQDYAVYNERKVAGVLLSRKK